jgi:hypothetical protein
MRVTLIFFLAFSACVQTTGGEVVSFRARAGGDPSVVNGGPLQFTSAAGYDVTLSRARFTLGAVYLNQQNPQSYSLETSCIQTGIYSGEVRGGLTLDALSPTTQDFPVAGNGTTAQTLAAELWLTGGDINADTDATVLLDVAGTATSAAGSFPFEGALTISNNRVIPPRNPALPGSNPLCRQRIVSPIAFDAVLSEGATVTLLVDPRAWFDAVDFSGLTKVSDSPLRYRFTDDQSSSAQPDKALYSALRSASGPYRLELMP